MNLHYIIPNDLTELSVRSFLKRQGFSLHLWRRLKHNGTVRINRQPVIAALAILHPGDELTCELAESSPINPMPLPLDIRYEDDYLLIVNKPIQQLVHPVSRQRSEATLANAVTYYYETTGQILIFHPLHRLDRNTSGLVLIAKQPHIQATLTSPTGANFHRRYVGIIQGTIHPPEGVIDLPLGRRPGSLIEQQPSPNGKPARSRYRLLAKDADISLLELSPLTGRTHQLRVHLAAIGHPLLGDDLYGTSSALIARPALHAFQIEFIHPVTKKLLCVSAPPPEDFMQIIKSRQTMAENFLGKEFFNASANSYFSSIFP